MFLSVFAVKSLKNPPFLTKLNILWFCLSDNHKTPLTRAHARAHYIYNATSSATNEIQIVHTLAKKHLQFASAFSFLFYFFVDLYYNLFSAYTCFTPLSVEQTG